MATAERDYYEVLGVGRDASDAEIKRAFRRLARELHPDVSDAPDADERFRELAEAYEVLSNAETRQLYDRYGAAGLQRGGYQPRDFDVGSLNDIFAAFFGESLFGQAGARVARPARGADVLAAVEISLEDAFTGTDLHVPVRVAAACGACAGSGAAPGTSPVTCPTCRGAGRVQQMTESAFGRFVRSGTCPTCDGAGRVVESPCERCEGEGRLLQERTLELQVPAGIHDGQRIRVRGEGHAGTLGGPPGDVFVQVRVRPDERLVRDGDDLVAVVGVTMVQAALGASVTISTPGGDVAVELEPGTQPGDVRVVRGRGMPALQSRRRGDLRVRVDVRIPRRLDDEQRELLQRLGEVLGEDVDGDEADGDDDGFFDRVRNAFR